MADVPQSRTLVTSTPYGAQFTYVGANEGTIAANGGTVGPIFDIARIITDLNQFQTAGFQYSGRPAVGPFLDVMLYTNRIGTLDVQCAVDRGGTLVSILAAPFAVAVSTPLVIQGLRIPARIVKVLYTNTDAANAALPELGVYVRSN